MVWNGLQVSLCIPGAASRVLETMVCVFARLATFIESMSNELTSIEAS